MRPVRSHISSDPHLILVVPCFNEEQRLPADELRNFQIDGLGLEILFVNDGSTDGTLRLLQSLCDEAPGRFSVLNLERNSGKAEAVRRGIIEALDRRPDLVGFWDADLATPLTEISGFLDVFANRPEIEMVFAARVRLLGRSISRNPARHYFGRVGATLISSSLGLAVYDTQCGAKLFRAGDAMREIFATPFLSRWIFDVEIIARLVRQRGREDAARAIYELPIMVWHDVKGSKVRSTDFGRALKDLWKIHRSYRK
jgi:glycosyltransferase involved in cell wall biosynthesis